jgi:hypothetical protein
MQMQIIIKQNRIQLPIEKLITKGYQNYHLKFEYFVIFPSLFQNNYFYNV